MNGTRPEHVTCALTGMHDGDRGPVRETWCGRRTVEFTFVDASHANLNGRNGGRLQLCRACSRAIAAALVAGTAGVGQPDDGGVK